MSLIGRIFGYDIPAAPELDPWETFRNPAEHAVAIDVEPKDPSHHMCDCGQPETHDLRIHQSDGSRVWMGACSGCTAKIAVKAEDKIRGRRER